MRRVFHILRVANTRHFRTSAKLDAKRCVYSTRGFITRDTNTCFSNALYIIVYNNRVHILRRFDRLSRYNVARERRPSSVVSYRFKAFGLLVLYRVIKFGSLESSYAVFVVGEFVRRFVGTTLESTIVRFRKLI